MADAPQLQCRHLSRPNGDPSGQCRRLLPAALIDSLVSPSQPLHPSYGMLWWRLSVQGSEAYVTRGHLATNMYVFPDRELIVVRMQLLPSPGDRHVEYEPAALRLFSALL